jgi:ABC transport system ATP-binding/permease protein
MECTVLEFIKKNNLEVFDYINLFKTQPNQTIHDILDHYKAFNWEERFDKLSKEFNFEPTTDRLSELSGGQLKKLQIISFMLFAYDIALLDEPTNHLDLEGIKSLEDYINSSKKAYIIVSHDRQFLDNVTGQFLEIWNKRTYLHFGNYNKYIESKATRLENEQTEDWKRTQYLKRELKWVRAGVKARGVKDKGRLDRFNELASQAKSASQENIEMVIPEPEHLGTRIIDIEKYSITKNGQTVLGPIDLKINKFDKIGIIGPNGSYKSTFILGLLDQLPTIFETKGTIKHGINTKILYFEQDKSSLEPETSVFDYISEGKEVITLPSGITTSTYKYLDNWLFFSDQYRTAIKNLSGGEKSRLLLAKKLLEPTNFLILDEPTNDLDLDTILLLESNLALYQAPVIVISHDRQFLNHICNIILAFGQTSPTISHGNYDYYLSKYPTKPDNTDTLETEKSTITINPAEQRRINAVKRDLEKSISQLESTIQKIDKELALPEVFTDYIKTNELTQKRIRISTRLDGLLEQLFEL